MDPAFAARQVSLGYEAAPFGSSTSLYGDEAITKAVIKNTADFFNEIEENVGTELMNKIHGSQLTAQKCTAFIGVIKSHPLLQVVPNEMNKEPSGSIRVTHKHILSVTDERVIGLIGEEGLAALQGSEKTEITFLGISEQAMNAILRHTKSLQNRRVVSYTPTYRESDLLVSKPKERSCQMCTIL